jgi:hypothetical protein
VFTGGDVIEDYRVNIRIQGETYSVLASGLTTTTYTAIDLTPGVIYEFALEARNSYGYSILSDDLALLNAFKPYPPLTVTTENVNE